MTDWLLKMCHWRSIHQELALGCIGHPSQTFDYICIQWWTRGRKEKKNLTHFLEYICTASLYMDMEIHPLEPGRNSVDHIYILKTLKIICFRTELKGLLCSFWEDSCFDNFHTIHTILICLYVADPATFRTSKRCAGDLISLWEQLVHSVMGEK